MRWFHDFKDFAKRKYWTFRLRKFKTVFFCRRRQELVDEEACMDCWIDDLPLDYAAKFEHRGLCIVKHARVPFLNNFS